MALYEYTGVDNLGTRRSGKVDARSVDTAIALLKNQNIHVLNIAESKGTLISNIGDLRGVPFSEVVSFTRQMSTMIGAGLPIAKTLDVLSQQTTNTRFRVILGDILRDVEGGTSIAASFSKYPDVFSKTYQSLVRAGEASGKLDQILLRLADTMESQRELRAKFKTAMIYPVLVMVAMVGVFFMLMVVVVPKLADMYESLDAELPIITQLMINLSDFMVNNLIVIILGMFGGLYLIRSFSKTPGGREFFIKLTYVLPVFGAVNKKRDLTEFCRTLGLLLTSAVPIVEALEIVHDVVSYYHYKNGAKSAAQTIEKGGTLSGYLKSDSSFPPIIGNMAATGEETGKLDEVLDRLAEFFNRETQHAVEGLSAALEPLILIMLGGMVAVLIISIITPIYKITTSI